MGACMGSSQLPTTDPDSKSQYSQDPLLISAQIHSSFKKHNLDIEIFENPNIDNRNNKKCTTICNENDNIVDMCSSLQRLITAHNYYKLLDVKNIKDDQEEFCKFINNIYIHILLNDYEHLMMAHRDDLYAINQIVMKQASDSSSVCQLKDCQFTSRHYRRDDHVNNDEKEEKTHDYESDGLLSFYCSLFDGIHFYLYHCFECGLRVNLSSKLMDGYGDGDDEKSMDDDEAFGRLARTINNKRDEMKLINRFKTSNNKFNLSLNSQVEGVLH